MAVLESLFIKVTGLRACNSIKKRLQQNCFPRVIATFSRTPVFTEYLSDVFKQSIHISGSN